MSIYEDILKKHLFSAIGEILILLKEGKLEDPCVFIRFNKSAEGIMIPKNLTNDPIVNIVLQHRFWDLEVTEIGFSVVLEFFGKKSLIVIPYNSIQVFSDTNHNFCLDFESDFSLVKSMEEDEEEEDDDSSIIEVDLERED